MPKFGGSNVEDPIFVDDDLLSSVTSGNRFGYFRHVLVSFVVTTAKTKIKKMASETKKKLSWQATPPTEAQEGGFKCHRMKQSPHYSFS